MQLFLSFTYPKISLFLFQVLNAVRCQLSAYKGWTKSSFFTQSPDSLLNAVLWQQPFPWQHTLKLRKSADFCFAPYMVKLGKKHINMKVQSYFCSFKSLCAILENQFGSKNILNPTDTISRDQKHLDREDIKQNTFSNQFWQVGERERKQEQKIKTQKIGETLSLLLSSFFFDTTES